MFRIILLFVPLMLLAGPSWAAQEPNNVRTERIVVDPATVPATADKKPDQTGKGDAKQKPAATDDTPAPASHEAKPGTGEDTADNEPVPDIHYGEDGLPAPVQRMRDELMEAAKSGDVEKLRAVLEMNEVPPTLSFGDTGDPIEYLKKTSGDGEGREVLAILVEVLESGWVNIEKGKPQEMYIWPYFAQYPLDKLTGAQLVELFEIVTAYDYKEMQTYGAYIFYRIGIGPDGTLHYFVAGD